MTKTVKEEVGTLYIDLLAETLIEEVQELIKNHGAGKVSFALEQSRYSDDYSVYVYVDRAETDEERRIREDQDRRAEERTKANELRQLKALTENYASLDHT